MEAGPARLYRLPLLRCRTGLRARLLTRRFAVEGCGFGAEGLRVGELVFSTSMTGYPESLTDPSYRGQILIYTHPMVGNYGVPQPGVHQGVSLEWESLEVQVAGFIVAELPRHWHGRARWGLSEWLALHGVPGMYRVDTRWLVKEVRSGGVTEAALAVYREGSPPPSWESLWRALEEWGSYDSHDFAREVSPGAPQRVEPLGGPRRARVSLLDCGVKHGIVRELMARGVEVVRMPCDSSPDDLLDGFDGVVIGSGPGNPALLKRASRAAGEVALSGKPVLGICLGLQLIVLGLGGGVYKLRFGHRGVNKPVVRLSDGRGFITTHNHGYAAEPRSLERVGLTTWLVSPDDGVVEGVRHESLPVLATQFHPEGGPGPRDASFVFDEFVSLLG